MPAGYFGIYRGTVVNDADPERRGRLILQVPTVTGFRQTGWAEAVRPSGFPAIPPKPGSPVWVEYEGGNTSSPLWMGIPGATSSSGGGDGVSLDYLHVGPDEGNAVLLRGVGKDAAQLRVGSRSAVFSVGNIGTWISDGLDYQEGAGFVSSVEGTRPGGLIGLQYPGITMWAITTPYDATLDDSDPLRLVPKGTSASIFHATATFGITPGHDALKVNQQPASTPATTKPMQRWQLAGVDKATLTDGTFRLLVNGGHAEVSTDGSLHLRAGGGGKTINIQPDPGLPAAVSFSGVDATFAGQVNAVGGGYFDTAFVGRWYDGNYAAFKNKNAGGADSYAVLQNTDGTSFFNTGAGKPMYFRVGNATKAFIDSSGGFHIGDASFANTSGHLQLESGTTGGNLVGISWLPGGAQKWLLYQNYGDANLYLRDTVNSRMLATFGTGGVEIHQPLVEQGNRVFAGRSGALQTFDWNTVTTAGSYQIAMGTWTNGPGPGNVVPNGSFGAYPYGLLEVFTSSTLVTQRYVTHYGAQFTRAKYNASDWTAWQTQFSENNPPPSQAGMAMMLMGA